MQSLAITLAIFVALGFGLHGLLRDLLSDAGFADGTLAMIATVIVELALFWIAFRAVAIGVVGPVRRSGRARGRGQALSRCAGDRAGGAVLARADDGATSAGRLIGYNLIASPLYIVLLATGVGLPIAFFAINGWLLGRDLGDMVAARHT